MQLRNARMTDALQLGPIDLAEEYPEVLESWDLEAQPSEEPYEFWVRTEDAALAEGVRNGLGTAGKHLGRLIENQPKGDA